LTGIENGIHTGDKAFVRRFMQQTTQIGDLYPSRIE
jgi:hypothetical protein